MFPVGLSLEPRFHVQGKTKRMHVLNSSVSFRRKNKAKSGTCSIRWML